MSLSLTPASWTSLRRLWGLWAEENFFQQELDRSEKPDRLFYRIDEPGYPPYVAYWPKGLKSKERSRQTLQSRNAPIGTYTENWLRRLLEPIAQNLGFSVVADLRCHRLGLDRNSPADLAFTRISHGDRADYAPEEIALIIEVKMSLVWNWGYEPTTGTLSLLGDYTTHQGRPSLLRSDSVLKAIGKGVNVHTSTFDMRIPFIVVGNSPLARSYHSKADLLRRVGLVDLFLSVNPQPLERDHHQPENVKETLGGGFQRVDSVTELAEVLESLLQEERATIVARLPYDVLGALITRAAQTAMSDAERGRLFLQLLEEVIR